MRKRTEGCCINIKCSHLRTYEFGKIYFVFFFFWAVYLVRGLLHSIATNMLKRLVTLMFNSVVCPEVSMAWLGTIYLKFISLLMTVIGV